MPTFGLQAGETRALRALATPERIQHFLDTRIAYNLEPDGDTLRSPRRVLRDRTAHCLEGALLAAAALRVQGFPPLLVDFESVRDDDHVIAVFKRQGHWGAIGKSNYAGLRFREPVYRSLRELAMSYFEHYFNQAREKTLRRYSRPVNLARFDRIGWMTAEEDLWAINDHLGRVAHVRLLRNGSERRLGRVDARLYAAGRVGHQPQQR
ncbi:MAG TPA: hypothetical protein VMV31_03915 [Terriglobales bacterium]|nr:hypothetical protein [Terriglobales bacterium]